MMKSRDCWEGVGGFEREKTQGLDDSLRGWEKPEMLANTYLEWRKARVNWDSSFDIQNEAAFEEYLLEVVKNAGQSLIQAKTEGMNLYYDPNFRSVVIINMRRQIQQVLYRNERKWNSMVWRERKKMKTLIQDLQILCSTTGRDEYISQYSSLPARILDIRKMMKLDSPTVAERGLQRRLLKKGENDIAEIMMGASGMVFTTIDDYIGNAVQFVKNPPEGTFIDLSTRRDIVSIFHPGSERFARVDLMLSPGSAEKVINFYGVIPPKTFLENVREQRHKGKRT